MGTEVRWAKRGVAAAAILAGLLAVADVAFGSVTPERVVSLVIPGATTSEEREPKIEVVAEAQQNWPEVASLLAILGIAGALAARCLPRRPLVAAAILAAGAGFGSALTPRLIASSTRESSTKAVARLLSQHAIGNEPVILYVEYLRGLPFYLRHDVILWNAGHDEFGHEVGEEEARGRAMQASRPAFRTWLEGTPTALVVTDAPQRSKTLEDRYAVSLEPLGHVGRFTVSRLRH